MEVRESFVNDAEGIAIVHIDNPALGFYSFHGGQHVDKKFS
ncbi:hypothetical protein [Paenibacillus typhae]|nr:hypothetical protein [Paenibacillus typhae]